ncbi:tryptophan-rich sensory protein TspO [Roseivivax sediminis]|uniref:TspO and MBR related proteins n=1 Tax=Roseivivax sediminis TaxID=936889 RepID=A0A1I1TXQ5_9RHOB|nr:TspO/MBR family protein [Roseivivax sediminis]SFD63294.1 TspO and MBR related proteins [Roseivivax sediminis]
MIWIVFVIFLAACVAAGTTGAIFPPGEWYRQLSKPAWTPPDWLFPVAWTTLYICMAAAGARVAMLDDNAVAMALWALQIALNTLWTPIFFGLHRIRVGMVVLGALWLAVAACMIALWRLDTIAGILFVPYLGWVSVACALNASILRRNPRGGTAA